MMLVYMGYLICEKCKGYYKLRPDESPKDFSDTCECGGKLIYYEMDNFYPETEFFGEQGHLGTTFQKLKNLLFFDIGLEKELKLFGVLFEIFAIVDLLFGLFIIFFIQEQLFIGVLAVLIGFSLLLIGALPFFFVDKKIYNTYTAATVALLLQYLILNKTLGLSIWGSIFFFILIGFFTGKAVRKVKQ